MQRHQVIWLASLIAAAVLAVPSLLVGIFNDELKEAISIQFNRMDLVDVFLFTFAFIEMIVIMLMTYFNAEKKEKIEALQKRNRDLIVQLETDTKSGLSSYDYLSRVFDDEYIPAAAKGSIFSVLMIDIVDFKTINDTLGHDAGDEAISLVGGFLKAFIRGKRDLAARYGEAADEFFFVISGDIAALTGFTNRLRKELQQESADNFEILKSNKVTLQFWSSGTEVKAVDSWDSVKKRLMKGLTKAKQASPGSIVIVEPE